MAELRTCRTCGEDQPPEEFNRERRRTPFAAPYQARLYPCYLVCKVISLLYMRWQFFPLSEAGGED
jgi:hypothetical protein